MDERTIAHRVSAYNLRCSIARKEWVRGGGRGTFVPPPLPPELRDDAVLAEDHAGEGTSEDDAEQWREVAAKMLDHIGPEVAASSSHFMFSHRPPKGGPDVLLLKVEQTIFYMVEPDTTWRVRLSRNPEILLSPMNMLATTMRVPPTTASGVVVNPDTLIELDDVGIEASTAEPAAE